MYPEDIDQVICMHILLKLQRLNPRILGQIIDILDLSYQDRYLILSNLFIKHPEVYFYLLDMFVDEEPER